MNVNVITEPVVMVDKITGRITRQFDNPREAGRELGVKSSQVIDVCKRKTVSAGRQIMRYAKDYDSREVFKSAFNNPVALFDHNKLVHVGNSAEEISRQLKTTRGNVLVCAKRNLKLCKRFDVVVLTYMGMLKDIVTRDGWYHDKRGH